MICEMAWETEDIDGSADIVHGYNGLCLGISGTGLDEE
jgi:hypothetical protein